MNSPGPEVSVSARWLPAGLVVLLLVATLLEGGGSPKGLLAWHTCLVVLLAGFLWLQRNAGDAAAVGPEGVVVGWTLFLVLCFVGVARVPYGYAGILVILELAASTAAAFLACSAGPDLLRRLILPLGVWAALEGGLAVYQSVVAERRPAGTFLVPNHLALWLSAVLLLIAARAAHGARRERVQALLLGLPVLAGIVVAGSRGAVLGLAAGGSWLLWVNRCRLAPRHRMAATVAGVALLLLLGTGLLIRMRGHDPFRYQRAKIWRASVVGCLDDPLWGTGPGQFEAGSANQRFPDGDGPLRYDRTHSATHSDWLRVPAEFGVPAALVLLATLGLAVRQVTRRRSRGELPACSDGALAALIAISVHAAVDNPSRWPAVYLLASTLCGALLATRAVGAGSSSFDAGHRRLGIPARLALSAALLTVFLVGDVAPFAAWRAVDGLPRGRLDAHGEARLSSAIRLNRIHPDYRMRMAEHLSAGPPALDSYAGAREAAEHAVRLQPRDSRFLRGLARVDARACVEVFRTEACRDRVRDQYLRAGAASNYDPAIPLELAMFLLDLGDPAGARRAAERALSLEPEAVLTRLVLAEALVEGAAPSAVGQAAELIKEAEEKATRWAGWARGPYAGRLLGLDRTQLARVQRKIAAVSESDSPGDDPLR